MKQTKPVSVIDIGSNSVRLVIYDGLKRSPTAIFNEKVLCALAENIELTGKLSIAGMKRADHAIIRFIKLSKIMSVSSLNVFATAAVRDAKDGHQFVDYLNSKYGLDIKILSGEEEARYAGLGVISTISKARGVVGDLGGGSLELLLVENEQIKYENSFPIGPLRLTAQTNINEFIEQYISQFPLKETLHESTFYTVGGAFRNIAKIHMEKDNYPLKVIHNYKVAASTFLPILKSISTMPESSLLKMQHISYKRFKFLPYAALILSKIITIGKPKYIVFTASGVREGFLFDQLNKKMQNNDPLISGCEEIISRISRTAEYGYDLAKWMSPLFKSESDRGKRLRLAVSIMSEISCYENKEYRGELAFRRILDSSLTGLNHKDRVFIATCLYYRYNNYTDNNILYLINPFLNSKVKQKAKIVGSAMKLARSVSCSCEGILEHTKIEIKNNQLILSISKSHMDLDGESINKRARQLADIIGVNYIILTK